LYWLSNAGYGVPEINAYFDPYLERIQPIVEDIKLSSDSSLSSMDGILTLKDTLLVMKAIHKNGFVIGDFPKIMEEQLN
jgi:hypothetical protein